MNVVLGLVTVILGGLNIVGAVVRDRKGEHSRSDHYETNAIGWFILSALLFR